MSKRVWFPAIITILVAVLFSQSVWAYSPGQKVPIPFPRTFLPFNSSQVSFEKTGGQVFVSNAPETINENGALRADGSEITGQYNASLYRDTVSGPFRFWVSHYNKTTHPLKFWVHVKNTSGKPIQFYSWNEAYSDSSVTTAASEVTRTFMDAQPNKRLVASIPEGGSYYFAYSDADHVKVNEAVVYLAQFSAEASEGGSDASVLVSHVVTTADVTDPTPYATTETIARTNATATKSDDYRGLLAHWGRTGSIDVALSPANLYTGVRLGDTGYTGEQEPLLTRWDVGGQPVEQREVRFITPTLNKLRLAYWYTDYDVQIRIANDTGYPVVHTLYGSNGSNPGFVNYQLNGQPASNYHFATNTAVPVTTSGDYRLRMMVMPSASLPYGLYFAAGHEAGVPNDVVVTQAEHTLLSADANRAEQFVNALPNDAERSAMLARLQNVRRWISAAAAVKAAEGRLQTVETELQAANLSIPSRKEREKVLEQLTAAVEPVRSETAAAGELVAGLSGDAVPALLQHAAAFRTRLAIVQGRINAIEAIIADSAKPMRQGNGKELSVNAKPGETLRLPELLQAAIGERFPQGGTLTWISADRTIATVTLGGELTASVNGIGVVYAYSDQGVLTVVIRSHP